MIRLWRCWKLAWVHYFKGWHLLLLLGRSKPLRVQRHTHYCIARTAQKVWRSQLNQRDVFGGVAYSLVGSALANGGYVLHVQSCEHIYRRSHSSVDIIDNSTKMHLLLPRNWKHKRRASQGRRHRHPTPWRPPYHQNISVVVRAIGTSNFPNQATVLGTLSAMLFSKTAVLHPVLLKQTWAW